MGAYVWNTKTQHHKFCKTCASSLMLDFTMSERGEEDPRKDIIGVNVSDALGGAVNDITLAYR